VVALLLRVLIALAVKEPRKEFSIQSFKNAMAYVFFFFF
jgi:hypothetical protein